MKPRQPGLGIDVRIDPMEWDTPRLSIDLYVLQSTTVSIAFGPLHHGPKEMRRWGYSKSPHNENFHQISFGPLGQISWWPRRS